MGGKKRYKKYEYSCPCCGSKMSSQYVPPRSHNICERCHWEDCPVQFKDHDFEGGANGNSLNKAKNIFAKFGVSALSRSDDVEKLDQQ